MRSNSAVKKWAANMISPIENTKVEMVSILYKNLFYEYDHDAYVMPGSKYSPEMSGENLTSVTPLQIIGPIFDTEGTYTFDIELRTIDSRDNWVFSLSGFNSQVTIEKHMVLEDLLRKIFSNYKTPILLNEIFN